MATNETSPPDNSYVLTSSAESDGTHQFGEVAIPPASIVRCFGQGCESDGFKVSRRWVFRKGNLIFTLYDWKSTDLYDSDMWSPELLWKCEEPFDLHVGSKDPATEKDVAAFIDYLRRTTSSAEKSEADDRVLRVGWCTCQGESSDPIFMPDNTCPCGVDKHHYHCPVCKRITQVG
jgi:hypothetical protein